MALAGETTLDENTRTPRVSWMYSLQRYSIGVMHSGMKTCLADASILMNYNLKFRLVK